MKERTMKRVFKAIAILFGGMFLYGVITLIAMSVKYGLHFGYVSDGSIELIGGLITIAIILGALLAGGDTTYAHSKGFDDDWRISTDEDDIITDPAYSSLECNIFHDSNY